MDLQKATETYLALLFAFLSDQDYHRIDVLLKRSRLMELDLGLILLCATIELALVPFAH